VTIRPLAKVLLVGLALLGASQILQIQRSRRAIGSQGRSALQTWEGEGGAVPVSTHSTAAEVTPARNHPAPG